MEDEIIYLHVWNVLEYERLVEPWITVLPVHLCLVLWFLVRQQVDLDKGVSEAGGPIGGRKVGAFNNLKNKDAIQIQIIMIFIYI
jgi:hypothetical protein